jgi:hypothetical protein
MKRIVLISFLFALLLAAGKTMCVNEHDNTIDSFSNSDTFLKDQVKFNKLNPTSLLTKYTDFDLEEEFFTNTNSKSNNLSLLKKPVLEKWYLLNNNTFEVSINNNLHYHFEPNLGQSTPIYLFNRVLRI